LDVYHARFAERGAEAARLKGLERQISYARVAVIAAAILAAAFSQGWIALAFVATFVGLAVIHERVTRRRAGAERGAAFYARGIDRLSDRWQGKGFAGDSYRDEHHPYAVDLDLFGRGSLFELICLAVTPEGRDKLAGWLKAPADSKSEISARQDGVRELRDAVDFREQIAVVAADVHPVELAAWSVKEPVTFASWERLGALVLPPITIVVGILALARAMPVSAVIAVAATQFLLARRMGTRVAAIVAGVERAEPALAQLVRVMEVAARPHFTATRLAALQRAISGTAPPEIEHLRRRVALLDARRNQFFIPFAMVLLWTTNVAIGIERWRRTTGRQVGEWIDAVAEIEALSSLASLAFENPEFVTPQIVDGPPRFAARALGHPLINASRRVTNDLRLDEQLRLLIISGSNMSGKSTLLRSAGVAAVLAFAGGPVCARSLEITPMRVGASIQIHDSLQEGASRFYAEILRIRQILDLARGPLLFLLDEILHGTNSHDRRIGAEGVVRRLVEQGAIGLVSTHDLALAQIADALAPRGANVHFEDHLEEGRMVFDYRMRAGVVERSNALALMRSVGIDV
jgi:hypothetical protein